MTTIEMTAALPSGSARAAKRRGQTDPQLLARLTGFLFVVTYVTSIPTVLWLYAPAVSDAAYAIGLGADPGLAWGALMEMILIVANIGTAVALFPVLRRQNEALALGYVTARIVESGFIAVGILSLLALGTLRQEAGGADADALVVAGKSLVAIHHWTFLLGPGFVVGIGNGLILGYLMFKSRLIPRGLAVLGLVGGPLIVLAGAGMLLGIIELGSVWQGIATVPEFIWELALGIWLLVKGFNPAALASLEAADDRVASASQR